jgi:hypothetical protein
LPKLDSYTKTKFEEAIAMHYFVTGTSFQRFEEENLAIAIRHFVQMQCYRRGRSLPGNCWRRRAAA